MQLSLKTKRMLYEAMIVYVLKKEHRKTKTPQLDKEAIFIYPLLVRDK